MATLPKKDKAFHITFRVSKDRDPVAYQNLWNLIRSHETYQIERDKSTVNYRDIFTQLLSSQGDIDLNKVNADSLVTVNMLNQFMNRQTDLMESMLEELGGALLDELLSDLNSGSITLEDAQQSESRNNYIDEAQRKAKERMKQYQSRYE